MSTRQLILHLLIKMKQLTDDCEPRRWHSFLYYWIMNCRLRKGRWWWRPGSRAPAQTTSSRLGAYSNISSWHNRFITFRMYVHCMYSVQSYIRPLCFFLKTTTWKRNCTSTVQYIRINIIIIQSLWTEYV